MRGLVTVAVCATAAMGMAADAASAKKVSRATCYGAGKTILANERIRVSAVVKKGKKPGLSTARYYACNQDSKQRFLIFKGGEFENGNRKEVVSPAFAGNLLAFQRAVRGFFSCAGPVIVFDTKRGRVMRRSTEQPGCIQTLVVGLSGFAAWGYAIEQDGDYLAALDSQGTRVLAHEGSVDNRLEILSLHLGYYPDSAIWIQDGQEMTAELK